MKAFWPNEVRPLNPASRFHWLAIAMNVSRVISGCSAGPPMV